MRFGVRYLLVVFSRFAVRGRYGIPARNTVYRRCYQNRKLGQVSGCITRLVSAVLLPRSFRYLRDKVNDNFLISLRITLKVGKKFALLILFNTTD